MHGVRVFIMLKTYYFRKHSVRSTDLVRMYVVTCFHENLLKLGICPPNISCALIQRI